jgi:hypothetical protein
MDSAAPGDTVVSDGLALLGRKCVQRCPQKIVGRFPDVGCGASQMERLRTFGGKRTLNGRLTRAPSHLWWERYVRRPVQSVFNRLVDKGHK